MESENGIGIVSGNNSKIVNNFSSRQCVICLVNLDTERNEKDQDNKGFISSKDIDINVKTEPVDFDTTEIETSNTHGANFDERRDDDTNTGGNVDTDEDSLLKLLNVKVEVPFPPSPTHRNSSPSQIGSCSYCSSCASRNKEISNLFSQMDELRRKLTGLKDCIELDFKDSFKRTLDTESNYPACINPEDIIDRKDFLRHHIAKSFNYLVIELPSRESLDLDPPVLIPDLPVDDLGNYYEDKNDIVMNDNDADADADDDDWEPILIVPSVGFSGSESDCENDANDLDYKINVRSAKTKITPKIPAKPRGRPSKKSKNKRVPPNDIPRKYLNLKQYKQAEAGKADLISNHATSTNVDTTDYTNLKKLHGLRKELGILVKRLPPHILAQHDMPPSADVVQNNSNNITTTNSRQLRSRLTLAASARQKQMLEMKSLKVQRKKRGQTTGTGTSVGSRSRISKADTLFKLSQARSDRRRRAAAEAKAVTPKTPLKCIFDDCQSEEIFHSFKEQEDHMRAAHSQLYEVSASEDEEERRKKEKPTQYKCLFADCSIFEFYKTEEEMNAHIKAIHGIDMDQENDPSENDDDSGDNENDYDNNSINLDDDGDNNNLDDDFLDNQPPSPCSNPDESLTTADGEINAEKPRPKPIPNRKPYTKSKSKSKNRLPSRYKCIFTDCDSQEIFNTLADRDKHVQAVHSDTLKPLEETEVEKAKRLERRERQKLRAKIIRDPNIAPKPRLHCFVEGCKSRRYFASDEEREMHMKKIHEGVTHPFECSECGRTYRSNQELGVHVKSVHLGEFSHMCHFCGKGFTSSANLNAHMSKHTNERNFKCETCLQTFKTQSGLVYHRRAIHMGDHERSHCCDRCGKSFFTAVKLNNHIKCVHNKTDKPIICDVCGKRFAIRNYLYMHMKVHKNQNQGKGLSLSSAGDSADLNLNVSEGTKPMGIPPKKVARKRTSKQTAHHNNSSLNSSGMDMGGFPGPGQDHHHGPSAKMEEERYLYETQDRQRQDSHGHNSSEMMSPTPTAGSSARLSYEPAIINIPHHHNSFNPHSESNSNLSTASGSTGTGARPGSNPPVPVDLSSNYQDQQQQHQVPYSNLNSTPHHPRGVNISRHFLCGDFSGQGPSGMIISPHPGSGGVVDNNPAGHGHFSNSGSIHNFLGIPGGSSSGTGSAGHQGTTMPLQVPTSSSSTLSLQHQYLQLTSTLENLGGFHPKF